MKAILNLITIIFLSLRPAEAREVPSDGQQPFSGQSVIDMGHIMKDRRMNSKVICLINTGDSPLHILDIDTGCDCITACYPSWSIPKGGKFTIRIRLDAKKTGKGAILRTLTVYTEGHQPIRILLLAEKS